MSTRYQVFVSSTYADLKNVRSRVIQTLLELDCIPAGMELFPAADEEQWQFIRRVIDDCDYYIVHHRRAIWIAHAWRDKLYRLRSRRSSVAPSAGFRNRSELFCCSEVGSRKSRGIPYKLNA